MIFQTLSTLAEPNRFRIVELLRSGPRPVNHIAARLALRQPQVSKHLRVLKEAGLVAVEPRAQQRLYRLKAEPLRELDRWIERYRGNWEARFTDMDELLEELQRKEKDDAQGNDG